MPQIEQLAATYSSQIFWLLVFFGFTFFVVGRGMVPKVMDTVAQRDKQISDDLIAAERARKQANEEEEAWRVRENTNRAEAQALIAEARTKAAAATEQRLAAAQSVIDTKLAEAEARIAEARKSAAAEIEDVAADATRDIVSRIAGLSLDDAAVRATVKENLVHG
ncbi:MULTISPECIES: F-type H+-transporting ATPase subunit b [Novosphingobium]|uniref:ATP synthase subunit b n=1 Tax=Novosphingobium pentaromativorans US6-1 TaxID=1088721 RepID=G6EEU4_9SPHN|nr:MULTISPECIES: F-type H+-transporting ATPase subunit b [Novosphingobium]AIT79331.1 ATPase [Novosphingobium pentaromativorans US6-1]EHJ60159.1 F-type H+-transporting ATPase subunit b [Novosphingobium pentaromativorans US6-1]CCA92286.1 F-type H+-transporting ATPase subunit b [Novosphingobium sp. PP1Y]